MYKVTIINDGKETVIHHPNFNDLKVIEGRITHEKNVADGFTFTILPDNPGYYLIRPLTTLIKVENLKTGNIEFDGRVLRPKESMSDSGAFSKSFICESELGYLYDSCQRHGEYHDISVRDFLQVMIDNHNRDVADDEIDKTFQVGIVMVTDPNDSLYRYLGYENTFDTIMDKLIDRLGGVLRVRKENGVRYLDYLSQEKIVKPTEIRLAKNLKSITQEIDPSEAITRLIPLGTRIESEDDEATDASQARLTIAEVNNGIDFLVDEEMEQALGTVVVKSHVWDDINTPSILKTRGQQYLRDHNRIKKQYTITALDLSLIDLDIDSFEVGYYYPIINPVMGINEELEVIKKTVDIINPNQNSLTVGDQFKTASEYQDEANRSANQVIELQSIVDFQARRIVSLRQELKAVDESVENVNKAIEEMDIDALNEAIVILEQAIQNLHQAIEQIPSYGPVTHEKDGLMLAADKQKLDKITVTNEVDLDALVQEIADLKARVEELENASAE